MKRRYQRGEELFVEIVKMVPGGLALGRTEDGDNVFVRGAYPGERAKCEVTKARRNYTECKALEVENPHEGRMDAPCPHFGTCGGCLFIDMQYDHRLKLKEQIVRDAFTRIAGLPEDFPYSPIVAAPEILRFRNKMEFAFGSDDERGIYLGLREPGNYNDVIFAQDCLLLPEMSNRFMDSLAERLNKTGLSAWDNRQKAGDLRYLTLRFNEELKFQAYITVTDESLNVLIGEILDELSDEFPEMVSAGVFVNTGTGGTAKGESFHLGGMERLPQMAGDVTFMLSPESFFQTNIYGTPLLVEKVEELAGSGGVLWDLFSGVGTLSLPLHHLWEKIYGIEIVEEAVEDAIKNAHQNGIDNALYIAAPVNKGFKELKELSDPEVVIFDPPRSGVGKKTMHKIARLAPPRIVYVSCNPETLAEDITELGDMYEIQSIQPVDMFPHTYHVEVVAHITRKS